MAEKKIKVKGLSIRVDTVNEAEYISLTDIAKRSSETEPRFLILSWLKNSSTLEFLETWEEVHNPDFNRYHMVTFRSEYLKNRAIITPKKWIEELNAIGITSKAGRYGGTYAHKDIALEFCTWISPSFKVYLIKEFQRLKEEEAKIKNLKWHISQITNNIEEVRNLLDTIPYQEEKKNRLNKEQ